MLFGEVSPQYEVVNFILWGTFVFVHTKGFLQDVINRFLFSLPALSCVAGGTAGLRHYTVVSAIGYDVIKFPAPDLLYAL